MEADDPKNKFLDSAISKNTATFPHFLYIIFYKI